MHSHFSSLHHHIDVLSPLSVSYSISHSLQPTLRAFQQKTEQQCSSFIEYFIDDAFSDAIILFLSFFNKHLRKVRDWIGE